MGKTAFTAIKSALHDMGIPMEPLTEYTGNKAKFITYNYASDHGADFGDDRPGCNVVSVQVHFCLPIELSYTKEKQEIRQRLFEAGFTYPEITEQNTNDKRHLIFECEYKE